MIVMSQLRLRRNDELMRRNSILKRKYCDTYILTASRKTTIAKPVLATKSHNYKHSAPYRRMHASVTNFTSVPKICDLWCGSRPIIMREHREISAPKQRGRGEWGSEGFDKVRQVGGTQKAQRFLLARYIESFPILILNFIKSIETKVNVVAATATAVHP